MSLPDKFRTYIEELEAERDQWQESCGQNYVRATEAEMREEEKNGRIAELDAELTRVTFEHSHALDRIAKLESFVEAYDAWDTVEETWPIEAWERLSAAREALDK